MILQKLTILLLVGQAALQDPLRLKFLFVTEAQQTYIPTWTGKVLKVLEDTNKNRIKVDDQILQVSRENEDESYEQLCKLLSTEGASLVLDVTWTGWWRCQTLCEDNQIPYLRGDVSIQPFVQALDQYLQKRNATDAALIFQNEEEVDQGLYYFIGNSILRIIVVDKLDAKSVQGLHDMRPSPSYYAIFAPSKLMSTLFNTASDGGITYRNDRWNFVFLDHKQKQEFPTGPLNESMSVLTPNSGICCYLQGMDLGCTCPDVFDIREEFLKALLKYTTETMQKLTSNGLNYTAHTFNCEPGISEFTNETTNALYAAISADMDTSPTFFYSASLKKMMYILEMDIQVLNAAHELVNVAKWSVAEGIQVEPGRELVRTRDFFRVGTTESIPWSYRVIDPDTGLVVKNSDGTDKWTGYCVDLIHELSVKMNFDYELVIPVNGTYGRKVAPDTWDGVVGDLKTGKTDIAVASLTMTAEREEVIDFVAPYFEQSGILIVIRKPVRKTSLFKFMTVLRMEVWLSIVGALTVTAIMIWILDKYSPYSARNNKKAYPYPCREFTLKESFWFALTSFTPQGGGEAPKALSGRTLVAAYWLFVVLMLATFTANLAAFLTVERMQSPVQSLEQLARQSRINYTVVKESVTHQYFINMKNAEDTLYRMWKELTLNASSDQAQYRVWDYPIKEQYGHILLAINESMPVENATVGFQKVVDHADADFAFIHDSSEIRYEVTRNCNLTTVGEVFSEQPYAVAVQQGSHLQEEISKIILDLQKDRYFEGLSAKYWNNSAKGLCPNTDDSEGITLESLGGVFIATLFGLALAMITLAGEIFYYKRKERNEVRDLQAMKKTLPSKVEKVITIGKTFKPVADKMPKVSHISVFPRHQFHP